MDADKSRRLRIPKLSDQPDGTGRFYATYRDAEGRSQKKRFETTRHASRAPYREWVNTDYKEIKAQAQALATGLPPGAPGASPWAFPTLMIAYLNYERGRVRPPERGRVRGLIEITEYESVKHYLTMIARWARENLGRERFMNSPFGELLSASDYNTMMTGFAKEGYAGSTLYTIAKRFWKFARWAENGPFFQCLAFGRDKVDKFGGQAPEEEWSIPSVAVLQKILLHALPRFRAIIWIGLGCGFGNDDIARVKPAHFDAQDYDLRRAKTLVPRSGLTPPLVWAYVRDYLACNPRGPEDLIFPGRNGKPLVYVRPKTPEEMAQGTSRHRKPGKYSYVRVDAIRSAWNKLLKQSGVDSEWWEGFYSLRHLGCTAAGQRLNMLDMYSFMGHRSVAMLSRYMQKVTPKTRSTIDWVNMCLRSTDLNVWMPKDQAKAV